MTLLDRILAVACPKCLRPSGRPCFRYEPFIGGDPAFHGARIAAYERTLATPTIVQGEGPSDEGLAELKRIDANLRDKATPPRPDKGTCDTCGGGVVIQRTETTGRAVPCPTCGGPGLVRPRRGLGRLETCPTCNGVDPDPIKTGGGM